MTNKITTRKEAEDAGLRAGAKFFHNDETIVIEKITDRLVFFSCYAEGANGVMVKKVTRGRDRFCYSIDFFCFAYAKAIATIGA